MAKKGFGKLIAFAAVTGAVAAGVSYVLQYKTYHKELEKDFREFEDGGDDGPDGSDDGHTADARSVDRNYISLSSSKDEFKVAAKDMAQATKNVLKDAGSLLSDTAHEAVSAAVDTAQIALQTVKSKKADFMEEHIKHTREEDASFEDEGFLDEDYVDEDDLYDYGRMEGEGGLTYGSRSFSEDYSKDLTDEEETAQSAADDSSDPAEEKKPGYEGPTATIEEDTFGL